MTSGGITINLLFDAAAMAAPESFRAGIQQAASLLTAAISDRITVNIKIDYSGTGGGAAAGPDNGQYESYSSVKTDLVNYATPGDTTFNALPNGSSIQGQSSVAVWNAQLKLWGLLGANDTTTDDGSATFATDAGTSGGADTLWARLLQNDGTLTGWQQFGVTVASSQVSSNSSTQAASTNDQFVFRPGIGAEVIANAPSPVTIELDGFSSVTSSAQLAALLNEAQTGQPQTLFQSTAGGHDTVIDLGNHDIITLINVSLAALHASDFIIH